MLLIQPTSRNEDEQQTQVSSELEAPKNIQIEDKCVLVGCVKV